MTDNFVFDNSVNFVWFNDDDFIWTALVRGAVNVKLDYKPRITFDIKPRITFDMRHHGSV